MDAHIPKKRRGPAAPLIVLSPQERAFLEGQIRKHTAGRSLSDRCRIVLMAADGHSNQAIAQATGHTGATVGKWRHRFAQHRLEGLSDEYRSGRPRTVSDERVAEVVKATLESVPTDATHWSLRSMSAHAGISHTTVRKIWAAFNLQPHRTETFKLSTDPLFVDKVHDIVGLYMSPPTRAIVLCVDEKSQIQALDREQPILPMSPGVPERHTHTYVRHGTTSLFAALDVATGAVIGRCFARHRSKEFLAFLKAIEKQVPEGMDVHLVMDNYATHKTKMVKDWLARRPHWHTHFTPTSASWINQVERWFAEITRKAIKRAAHTSVAALEADIEAFIAHHNANPKPYTWVKSADDILASVKRFCLKVQATNFVST